MKPSYVVLAMATARYCSGVERIPEHIPAVIFVSLREVSPMFEERHFAI